MTPQNQNDELNAFIEKYIDQLMKDLKLGDMTPQMEKDLRGLVRERVEKRLMAMIIQNLPDEEIDKIMEKLDKEGITETEEVEAFAQAVMKIPNFPDKFKQALLELHKELTEDAEELKKYASGGGESEAAAGAGEGAT